MTAMKKTVYKLFANSIYKKYDLINPYLFHVLNRKLKFTTFQWSQYLQCPFPGLQNILPQNFLKRILKSCLNFWDEAWWFLSLRVYGLLSSALWLFPQRFGLYVLWPSSGVCRNREPSRNFELRPLLNPGGVTYSDSVSHNLVQVLSIPVLLLACSQMIVSLEV